MSIKLGDRVGDYEVIAMLGAGGMGAVFQVRHLISDRIEALKVLLPEYTSDPDLSERFVREIRVHAGLNHPNIAALHNALKVDGQLVMIIEYVEGETLSALLRRGTLSLRAAVDIAMQVLLALEYAHSRGVIHRDIKPSNIMVTPQGMVKIMDFGIAFGLRGLAPLTQAGAAVGSIYYMSPEQVRGDRVDARSDLYSVGVTLFEAVTGAKPFHGNDTRFVLDAHMHQSAPNASALNPAVPDALSRVIARSLEKDPSHRYQTAGDFARELSAVLPCLTGVGPTVSVPPARIPDAPSWAAKTPSTLTSAFSFDPLGLERVRKDLAQHIGPMAKVLVDRAAKRCRTWNELYSLLSNEVPAGKDRQKFLAGCPR